MNIPGLRMPSWLTWPVCQAWVIALGILLRLRHYAENRSFWQDEICLALSIVNRSWQDIWQHKLLFPDFAQAPLFFQLIEKTAVSFFGNSEQSLRLFPFVAAIASLFLARRFFRRYLDAGWATLALLIFALIEPLVYFAAELKPYGVDVLAALLVYEMFAALKERWDIRSLVIFAVGGAFIIWLSNAMLFILAGCGIVLFFERLKERDNRKALQLLFCYGVWLFSFILLYKLSLGKMLNPDLLKNWRLTGGFSPAPIWTPDGIAWAWGAFLQMFKTPLGMGWPYVAGAFFMAGAFGLFRRDKGCFFFFLLPAILTLFAAAFEKYPFYERLILFLVPSILLVLVFGVRDIALKVSRYAWMPVIVCVVVLAYPLTFAFHQAFSKRGNEENREAMAYLAAHYKPGDLIALSPQAQYPFWYYAQRMGLYDLLARNPIGGGKSGVTLIQLFPDVVKQGDKELLALRRVLCVYDEQGYYRHFMLMGKASDVMFIPPGSQGLLKGMGRVWVFLSHHNSPEYPHFVNGVFSSAGQRVELFERPGAAVFLYNISKEN